MKLTIDEYAKKYKMSKQMVYTKIKAKSLDFVVENGEYFIVVAKEKHSNAPVHKKEKPTVAMVISLYQKENKQLKNKIAQLEAKIDKLVAEKEQMLREERDKIEYLFHKKDEQLKNILELINAKMKIEQTQKIHEIEIEDTQTITTTIQPNNETTYLVELKDYLKSLNLKPSQKKSIKKRFLKAYDSDVRVIKKDGKIYLDLTKYDYSDFLEEN